MKIALVGRYGEGEILTGPERVARELFSGIKRKNIEVVFLEYFFSGYNNSSIFKKIFGKEFIDSQSILRLGIVPFLIAIKRTNFEIIHIVNSQRFVLFILLLKFFIPGKIVTTFHGFMLNEIPTKHYLGKRYFVDIWVERLLVKKSALLIFPSELLFDKFRTHYQYSNTNYQIIPNGISEIFNNSTRQFPQIKDSIKLVFYNGSKSSINRGLDHLLQMLKRVKCNLELFVIGNNINLISNDSKNIITTVPQLPHNKLIDFLSDKHFIIKSIAFDTFPLFVTECMSFGLIPIVNKNIGIRDYIRNEVNGFSYSGFSEKELPELIENISKGSYDLEKISANARIIFNALNWSEVTKKYLTAYESIK